MIYSPDPFWSAIIGGMSDGEFSLAWAARNESLIGGTLVLVGSPSGTSKLRLVLDGNTERIFCLNHFLGVGSLFGGVDMARGTEADLGRLWERTGSTLNPVVIHSERSRSFGNFRILSHLPQFGSVLKLWGSEKKGKKFYTRVFVIETKSDNREREREREREKIRMRRRQPRRRNIKKIIYINLKTSEL